MDEGNQSEGDQSATGSDSGDDREMLEETTVDEDASFGADCRQTLPPEYRAKFEAKAKAKDQGGSGASVDQKAAEAAGGLLGLSKSPVVDVEGSPQRSDPLDSVDAGEGQVGPNDPKAVVGFDPKGAHSCFFVFKWFPPPFWRTF